MLDGEMIERCKNCRIRIEPIDEPDVAQIHDLFPLTLITSKPLEATKYRLTIQRDFETVEAEVYLAGPISRRAYHG